MGLDENCSKTLLDKDGKLTYQTFYFDLYAKYPMFF